MFARRGRAANKVTKPALSTRTPNQTLRKRVQGPNMPIPPTKSPSSSLSPPPPSTPEDGNEITAGAWASTITQGALQLSTLLVKVKNKTLNLEQRAIRIDVVKVFLRYLEFEVEMTPALKEKHNLDGVLALPERPDLQAYVPPEIAAMCQALLSKFDEENWGADEAGAGAQPHDSEDEEHATIPSRPSSSSSALQSLGAEDIRLPPASHPIWGTHGIMHGLALKQGIKTVYCLDPRYLDEKRDAKVFGHNGLQPGAWWPYQKLAHYHGAHGGPIRGITGTTASGAYSIVTSGSSGTYDDLDQDFGDKLYYSADNSHDNTDPNTIAFTSNATQSLHKSLETGRPVRVLRSSGGKKAYTPKLGIRYDGLYRVRRVRRETNNKGGLYEQFELDRLPGQRSLVEIQATVPTREQQDAFNKIKSGERAVLMSYSSASETCATGQKGYSDCF